MRLLLDSHSLIWAIDDPTQLSPPASAALRSKTNDVLISAATIWELAIKLSVGKLSLAQPFRPWMQKAITDLGAVILPITVEYADAQSKLPNHHRDPFDRLLAAQALVENIPIVTSDVIFASYGVTCVW